jgi:hypothetical protein
MAIVSTLKNNTPTPAKVGTPFLLQGKGMLLIPLAHERGEDSLIVNISNEKARPVACTELRMAFPDALPLALNDEQTIVAILQGRIVGQSTTITKVPQANDQSRYNIRLASNLASANTEDITAFVRSMMSPANTEDLSNLDL